MVLIFNIGVVIVRVVVLTITITPVVKINRIKIQHTCRKPYTSLLLLDHLLIGIHQQHQMTQENFYKCQYL